MCTTGADWFDISGTALRSCTTIGGQTGFYGCMKEPHGIIEPLGDGRLLATDGQSAVLEIDRDGNVTRIYDRVSTGRT